VAVILPGPLISDIRGKVADLVFERNAGGLYVRSKGIVTQEPSDPRTAARNALILCSAYYRTSTNQEQKDAWTAYARTFPDTDRWGRSKARTGQQAFISFFYHTALAYGSCPWWGMPTIPPQPKTDLAATIQRPNGPITITTPFANWTAPRLYASFYVYQGKPVHETRNYFSSPWRFAGYLMNPAPGWPENIIVPSVFALAADETSWIKLHYIDSDPWQDSRTSQVKAVPT